MLPRWLICRTRRTSAGLATDSLGIILHAPTAEAAVENARRLGMFAGLSLVAIPEAN